MIYIRNYFALGRFFFFLVPVWWSDHDDKISINIQVREGREEIRRLASQPTWTGIFILIVIFQIYTILTVIVHPWPSLCIPGFDVQADGKLNLDCKELLGCD